MPMNHEQFMEFIVDYESKCDAIFEDRKEAYSIEGDRLSQFFELAADERITPMKALLDMAKKHFSMAMNLAKNGTTDLRLWNMCCMDLRNYALLLAAVAHDERVQGTPGPIATKLMGRPVLVKEDPEDAI